jgi:IS30 family transposase
MKTYKQLTSEQRYQISALKRIGHSPTEIAKELEVHKSTIVREVSRNTGERGYRPKQAHEKASERRANATSRKRISVETWKEVEEKLRQDWSPEQVSGGLEKHQAIRISHEWIYQHILVDQQVGGKLYTHLRQHGKRRKRYGKHDRRGTLPNRVSIEERPQIVEQRERLGDWEIDTLVGKGQRGARVSLVERKSPTLCCSQSHSVLPIGWRMQPSQYCTRSQVSFTPSQATTAKNSLNTCASRKR